MVNYVNGKLNIITCSAMNCEACPEFQNSTCWNRVDSKFGNTVVYDSEKSILHMLTTGNPPEVAGPPISGIGWESVFVGGTRIQSEIQQLQGIVKAGPYFMMFSGGANRDELLCIPVPRVRSSLELSLLDSLLVDARDLLQGAHSHRESIDQQMRRVSELALCHINEMIPELSREKTMVISEILGHRATSFGVLIPFLLMEKTEEVFLDRPNSAVYFDHQDFGRCLTSVSIDESAVSRLITLMRAETNLHLDRSNPSLKAELQLLGIPLRISTSIRPLSVDGFHLEIRRARFKPFTLQDLIDNGTISSEAAAILLLALASRFNITITGGPGTGKTTLLNALDMTTPDWWRKVYIEDASESRRIEDHHQVKLSVDPIDERLRSSSKENEIVKSLHRSPDYLILGEIQTREHSEALFQAVAAGLKVMQTCHSDSAAGLISRWSVAHGIAESSVCQMDLIVTLVRPRPGESKRVVSEVVEVCRDYDNGLVTFSGLNSIYSSQTGITNEWARNGPFMIIAKSLGLESHKPALEKLMMLISDSSEFNIASVPSLLWSASHPFAYSN